MATRTLIIDLSKGTGGEPMYGMVTVQRTRATSEGTFEVLPWETKLKLFNGIATITEAVTDGSGPFYDSAYLIRVQNGYCAPRWGFMAALPDGTTPISTGDMPKVNPITGEGIYMDAQEWNALYGDLPDRVSSLESSQATQNTQIASLETGKANKAHSHVIGDVTGLQTALNTKGNATMRVDTTVGTRVFISDGVTEQLVSSDTGWRDISSLLINGWTGKLWVYRKDNIVHIKGVGLDPALATTPTFANLPVGFTAKFSVSSSRVPLLAHPLAQAPIYSRVLNDILQMDNTTSKTYVRDLAGSFPTIDPWPTTLPGLPA